MEMRDLLEKMMKFAGEKVGQKPGEQWKGTDKAPPGKQLVGDSILKDLSKGKSPKTKEQELAEEFHAFLEAEFKDTVDRRPGRKSDRPTRGHKEQPRYKTIKADESAMSEKDIELQDYRSMTNQEFQTAYGISKTEWINQNKELVITNPDIKRGLGLEEGAADRVYTVNITRSRSFGDSSTRSTSGTIQELLNYFGYTLEVGKSYERERGRYKINMNPRTIQQLVDNLNKAASNAARNAAPSTYYSVGEEQVAEGWESGPEEYKEPYDDADDAYDRMRQEKIDTDAEREWAKLPKVTTYKLLGRGPKMEPNWDFGGTEYPSQEAAIDARAKLMADPNTPNPRDIGIQTITRVKNQTNEAVYPPGSGIVKNLEDYTERRDYILSQLADIKQAENYAYFKQALFDLNRMAKAQGIPVKESRAHKQLSTWFANRDRLEKFAKGELNIPTPQERRAQLEKQKELEKKKTVKEYGAENPPQKTNPAQAQQVAANLNIQKTALGQLKQINPDIDPQKAATAMTKDTATMSPQEKEELAQVAKTVSPALGTPAFGSIKTAIQKSQIQTKK